MTLFLIDLNNAVVAYGFIFLVFELEDRKEEACFLILFWGFYFRTPEIISNHNNSYFLLLVLILLTKLLFIHLELNLKPLLGYPQAIDYAVYGTCLIRIIDKWQMNRNVKIVVSFQCFKCFYQLYILVNNDCVVVRTRQLLCSFVY